MDTGVNGPRRGLLDRRVQVVAGKGGVGRTTLACSLALLSARQGHRTLLLEVDSLGDAARRLGVDPAVDEPREVLDGLWLCNMTPAGSMEEYALMILRFRLLYRLVFENRIVRSLLKSIPSLGEVTMAGKFWYHTVETGDGGRPRFDRLILDAPATGHAITFLSVSRVVADVVPPGRMRQEALRMAEMIEDEADTCVHVATLAEEMPVNEALDLEVAAVERARMTLGLGFLNRFDGDWLTASERRCVDRLRPTERTRDVVEAARGRLRRSLRSDGERDRLLASSRMPYVTVPDFGVLDPGSRGLMPVIDHLRRDLFPAQAGVGS